MERQRTWPFLAPLVVALGVSSLLPVAYSLFFSATDWRWGSSYNFVAFQNYVGLLEDHEYWLSLLRTASFAVLAVCTELVVGLVLALAVSAATRGKGWLRTLFILPLMVSGIVVSLVWKSMLDPTLGVIPYLLGLLGLEQFDLLGSTTTALPALAGIDTWWQTGFVFIILAAGIAGLPADVSEAAVVDGAAAFQRFRYITLPLLSPLIWTVAAIRCVDCLKVFALPFGATNGGPNQSTNFTQLLAYRTAFREFGMAESMTMMTTYTLLIVTALGLLAVARRIRRRLRHA